MNEADATSIVAELYDTYYASLVRYAWRTLGHSDAAEDVVQEAFFDLYKALRDGKEIDNERAWLLCVTRRKLIRKVRVHSRERRSHQTLDWADERMPALTARMPEPAEEVADWRAEQFLASLSPREEEVLLLRLSALKYREIAEKLEISAKSVSTLLTRAIRKIRAVTGREPKLPKESHHAVEPEHPETLQ